MLEMFRAPKFMDFSLEQWLANTPSALIVDCVFKANPKVGEKFVQDLEAAKIPVKGSLRGKL